jgi:hypothetical protein
MTECISGEDVAKSLDKKQRGAGRLLSVRIAFKRGD